MELQRFAVQELQRVIIFAYQDEMELRRAIMKMRP